MAENDRSSAHDGRKNRKLEQFVENLLSAPTVESAARSAGLSARTAWRRMRDPAVVQRLAEARRQSMQHAMMRLQAAASAAVACLCAVQQDAESESAKVSAARTILEMALRAAEIGDIEERLTRLEQLVKNNRKGPDDHQPNHTQVGAARRTNGSV
jgi:hypothetical protein